MDMNICDLTKSAMETLGGIIRVWVINKDFTIIEKIKITENEDYVFVCDINEDLKKVTDYIAHHTFNDNCITFSVYPKTVTFNSFNEAESLVNYFKGVKQ